MLTFNVWRTTRSTDPQASFRHKGLPWFPVYKCPGSSPTHLFRNGEKTGVEQLEDTTAFVDRREVSLGARMVDLSSRMRVRRYGRRTNKAINGLDRWKEPRMVPG